MRTLQFFHQYLFFSLAAQLSNWEAPAWRASALSSSSESFWSLSKTLSTFTRMMSTTWREGGSHRIKGHMTCVRQCLRWGWVVAQRRESRSSSPLPLGPASAGACGCWWYWAGVEVRRWRHLHQELREHQGLQLGQNLVQTFKKVDAQIKYRLLRKHGS